MKAQAARPGLSVSAGDSGGTRIGGTTATRFLTAGRAVLSIVGLAVAGSATAQYSERIEVRLHQLNVIVETRDGKLVTDLTKDDFIVLKDRKPQVITNFSLYVEPSPEIVQADDAKEETQPRDRRRFVFYIDDVDIYPTTRDFLLRRMADLLGAMGNGDEGMVVTPGSKRKIPQYLTGDKQALMATLARVTREMMHVGDSTPTEDPWEPKLPGAIEIPKEKEQVRRRDDCGQSLGICSKNRLASLRSVVKALGQLPGKKVLRARPARTSMKTRARTVHRTTMLNTSLEATYRLFSVDLGAKLEIFNVTDRQGHVTINNTVWCGTTSTAACQTAVNNYGTTTARGSFQAPRSFRVTWLARF